MAGKLSGKRLGVIGLGNMGAAMVGGLVSKKVISPGRISGCEINSRRRQETGNRFAIKTYLDPSKVVRESDVLLFCVKPQSFPGLAERIYGTVLSRTLVVSIMAGISTAGIENALGGKLKVIRAMPNTPAILGEGMTAFCRGSRAGRKDSAVAAEVFGAVGLSLEVKEEMMDVVTGLSGSGPAYYFLMMEALSEAGVKLGLRPSAAELLAAQTALGAARMVRESGEKPSVLRGKVTSKGGTTEAGLMVLKRGRFRRLVMDTVKAAAARSKELGKGMK